MRTGAEALVNLAEDLGLVADEAVGEEADEAEAGFVVGEVERACVMPSSIIVPPPPYGLIEVAERLGDVVARWRQAGWAT